MSFYIEVNIARYVRNANMKFIVKFVLAAWRPIRAK